MCQLSLVSMQNARRPGNQATARSGSDQFQRCVLPHTEEKRHEDNPLVLLPRLGGLSAPWSSQR